MVIVVPAFAEHQQREQPQAGSMCKTAQANFCFATARPHTFRERNSFRGCAIVPVYYFSYFHAPNPSHHSERSEASLFAECGKNAPASTNRDAISGRHKARSRGTMAERPVLVGLIPQVVVLDPGDQISWISDAGNLRVEFDVNRCPFSSNIFQAPAGMRLLSGPPRVGLKAATYKYRLWLNDQLVGQGEVILREK